VLVLEQMSSASLFFALGIGLLLFDVSNIPLVSVVMQVQVYSFSQLLKPRLMAIRQNANIVNRLIV